MTKTCVIIGAGPAGLTAAYELLKKTDIKPIILEATDAIGGISKTVEYHGNYIDIGGHRFFSKNNDVVALWNEIMPLQSKPSLDDIILKRTKDFALAGPDPENDEEVMLIRNRVSRILYLNKFFDYPISLKWQTFHNMGFIRTMHAGFGYLGSTMVKKKETSLENFYINRFGRPLYSMFFEKYTEKVWGRHPSQIDASWGAQRVKGLSLMKTIGHAITKPFRKNTKAVETSLIEAFYYPKRGPGQLYETMAKRIEAMGGIILKNALVNRVYVERDQIQAIEYRYQDSQQMIQADYYISSMPLKDLFVAIGQTDENRSVYHVATHLVYRDFITVGLLLPKLKLVNKTKISTLNNIIPDTWIYVQEDAVKVGRLQIFNNWSPYMVKDPLNTVWIGLEYFVNENDELWSMDDDAFIQMAIRELNQIKVIDQAEVLDAVRIKVKKAYPGYFDTYSEIHVVVDYLNKINNLYCIGRNGQHRYNNMDHSMLTAMEAVKSIIEPAKYDKKAIWSVNTEKEYHETKSSNQQ